MEETIIELFPDQLTNYERTRIISLRADELSKGASTELEYGDEVNPINIAMMEYNLGIIPDTSMKDVIRVYPSGERFRIKIKRRK